MKFALTLLLFVFAYLAYTEAEEVKPEDLPMKVQFLVTVEGYQPEDYAKQCRRDLGAIIRTRLGGKKAQKFADLLAGEGFEVSCIYTKGEMPAEHKASLERLHKMGGEAKTDLGGRRNKKYPEGATIYENTGNGWRRVQ